MITTSIAPEIAAQSVKKTRGLFNRRLTKGFTMAEMMITILVLGILAAIAVPIFNGVRGSGYDNDKIMNADILNGLMTTVHNGGVDTSAWTTSTAAINALRAGVTIPSVSAAAQVQQVLLQKDVNPAAYTFTPSVAGGAGTPATAPQFAPILNQPNVAP